MSGGGVVRRKRDPEEAAADLLSEVEARYQEEDFAGAEKALARARKLLPGDLTVKEWESTFAADGGRFTEALSILDSVLSRDPGRPFAARQRPSVLMELGRFEEALKELEKLRKRGFGAAAEPEEEASIHFDIACCLDRLGGSRKAEAEFRLAARLAPEEYPVPSRLSAREFDAAVAAALNSIPAVFQPYLEQVRVLVRDYPAGHDPDPYLLGLYEGFPRTERPLELEGHLDTVLIFKRNHELLDLDAAGLRDEIRKTVIHEIAHHFGLGEEAMGDYA